MKTAIMGLISGAVLLLSGALLLVLFFRQRDLRETVRRLRARTSDLEIDMAAAKNDFQGLQIRTAALEIDMAAAKNAFAAMRTQMERLEQGSGTAAQLESREATASVSASVSELLGRRRPGLDLEKWVGVRGAGVLGAAILVLPPDCFSNTPSIMGSSPPPCVS